MNHPYREAEIKPSLTFYEQLKLAAISYQQLETQINKEIDIWQEELAQNCFVELKNKETDLSFKINEFSGQLYGTIYCGLTDLKNCALKTKLEILANKNSYNTMFLEALQEKNKLMENLLNSNTI